MKLADYIESKKEELVRDGYKSAKHKRATKESIEKDGYLYMRSISIDSDYFKGVDLDMEVEEFTNADKSNMSDGEKITIISVDFDVVKPRCRKPVDYKAYVRPL